jgi:hypothetical protein
MDGTHRGRRGVRDDGAGSDNQHLAFNQTGRDSLSSPREDPSVSLSRHPHPLGRSILIKPFHIGEPDRFEFVEADGDRVSLALQTPDRTEAPTIQVAANATRDNGAGHVIESICS